MLMALYMLVLVWPGDGAFVAFSVDEMHIP